MWTAVLLVSYSLNSTFQLINGPKNGTPLYRCFKSNLDKSYEVTQSKYQHFHISHVTISKMWTARLLVSYSLNSTFQLINGPKNGTPLYRWFKSNLDRSYEVTQSKYQHFHNSHVTISKMWIFYGFSYGKNKMLPDELKLAEVVPVFKKNYNYRPISNLSIFQKITKDVFKHN